MRMVRNLSSEKDGPYGNINELCRILGRRMTKEELVTKLEINRYTP